MVEPFANPCLPSIDFYTMALEIAGIVLGAIPLAIKVFDLSASLVETLARLHGFHSQLNGLRSNLDTQRVIFLSRANEVRSILEIDHINAFSQSATLGQSSFGLSKSRNQSTIESDMELLEKLLQALNNTLESIQKCLNSIKTKVGMLERNDDEVCWKPEIMQ